MHTIDINTLINIHVEKRRMEAFQSVQDSMKNVIKTPEFGLKKFNDNNDLILFFERKYGEYVSSLKSGVEKTKTLFKTHGIEFRLYDIHITDENPGTIILEWDIGKYNYNFVIVVDNSDTEEVLNYKLGARQGSEIIKGSYTEQFDFEKPLPEWFISGLRQSYC